MLMRALTAAARRRPRLADQRGFTLIELMIVSMLGVLIVGSATMITIGAARHNNEVAQRTDANQRGRLAIERMVRLVRSQVCPASTTLPIASASSTSLSFYADLSGGAQPAIKHTFTFDATGRRITDTIVRGSAVTNPTFTGTATTEVLATDVETIGGSSVFRYYAYPTTAPSTGTLQPNVELVPTGTASLTSANLARVSRIDLDFVTTGSSVPTRGVRAEEKDQVFVRIADPNSTSSDFDPSCT